MSVRNIRSLSKFSIHIFSQDLNALRSKMYYFPQVLCVILIVLMALISAQLTKSVINEFPAEKRTISSSINNHVSEDVLELLVEPYDNTAHGVELARMHLMGKATEVSQVQLSDAPKTKLNLKLNGVIALGDGQGYAIIQSENRTHKLYQIDNEIISGVTLHSVFNDYVLISRSGLREKLTLPRADMDSRDSQRTFNPSDHDIQA